MKTMTMSTIGTITMTGTTMRTIPTIHTGEVVTIGCGGDIGLLHTTVSITERIIGAI